MIHLASSYTLFDVQRGSKRYELTNHLGNVLVVVSDKRIPVCSSNVVTNYVADVVSVNDYSAFGAPLAGRSYTSPNTKYRFGFNGKEKDNETYGDGNEYDFGARICDVRLGGRFFSIDPFIALFPELSSYCFANNSPIAYTDFEGKYKISPQQKRDYPKLTNYLTNGIKELLASPELKAQLMKLGHISEEKLNEALTDNNGANLVIGNTFTSGGDYQHETNTMYINANLALQFENALPENRQAALLAVVAIILHETVHYARDMHRESQGFDDGQFINYLHYEEDGSWDGLDDFQRVDDGEAEVGEVFEKSVFGRYIGDPFKQGNKASDYLNDAKKVIAKVGSTDNKIPQIKTPDKKSAETTSDKKNQTRPDTTYRPSKKR